MEKKLKQLHEKLEKKLLASRILSLFLVTELYMRCVLILGIPLDTSWSYAVDAFQKETEKLIGIKKKNKKKDDEKLKNLYKRVWKEK